MTKTKIKQLTFTVGIPTCYGGDSLVSTIKSLRASKGVGTFPILVVADRTPITPQIRKQLRQLGVKLTWNKTPGSQFKKIKQLIEMTKTDIFISTQDDITFTPTNIQEIISTFNKHPDVTMASVNILGFSPETFFESVMNTMLRLVNHMGRAWNKSDNHLMASGRCLAYRTQHLKKFRHPEEVVNGDMFSYLENKRLTGVFKLAKNAYVYIRCPQKFKDQIGPSSRYQYSQTELSNYFDFDISNEYQIPFTAMFQGILKEVFFHPFQMAVYLIIHIYTRLMKQSIKKVADPVWQVDESTKNVGLAK